MRTLQFVVDGHNLKLDSNANTKGLRPGTEKEVKAEFIFSDEWKGMTKVVSFTSLLGEEYPPQLIVEGDFCMIPKEALCKTAFEIQVLGRTRWSNDIIKTKKLTFVQNGGNA